MELFGKNNNAKKLISYAASFGDTTLQRLKNYEVEEEIGTYLKRFNSLSVRDNNSAEIVEKLCGIIPYQHFDPTLISNLEELKWKECKLDRFMVVYGYERRFSEEEGAAIMSFAQKRQLTVVTLNAPQIFGDVLIRCRPDELLGYFAKAEYVVTDTFHGTIFSVLYHKPLAVFCRTPDDTHYSNQNKLIDLIEKLKIKERHVMLPEMIEETLERDIDYEAIDRIRVLERERALSYLRKECGE